MNNKLLSDFNKLSDKYGRSIFDLFIEVKREISLLKDDIVLLRAEMDALWPPYKRNKKILKEVFEVKEEINDE